jgi:hypothetical protein
MKYLNPYKLFENLQQAENYIAKNNLDPTYFEKLKEITKQKGLLYLLTIILYSSKNQQKELKKIETYLDKITQSNIKIDTNQITPDLFYQYVDNQISKTEANKFVDEFAPGKLKKEIKSKYLDKIINVNFQSISKEALRGKMSIFNKPEDWVKYIIRLTKGTDNITSLKTSNDVEILYEDSDWLIYVPKSYEAINYINYPQWCTIYEDKYNGYIEEGYYFIIIHNKQDKKLSYIIQVFPEHARTAYDLPENAKDYFSLHPYNGKAVWLSWKPEMSYYGWNMTNLDRGGIKIFFDEFVRNNKVFI